MKPLIIKLGGVILDNKDALNNLFVIISNYKKNYRRSLIIVHGGGSVVDSLMDRLSMPVVRRNGLRVTPADQIDVIVGSLAGSANTRLLSEAKKQQIAVVGLCLADGNSVEVKQISEDLGYVGEARAGDPTLINLLVNAGYLPIISSIGITENGQMMNVNADHAAVALAKTLNADLILLSDVVGVFDENKQLIESLTQSQADQLIANGVITDGMIVKVNSAFEAAKVLGRPIDIASWMQSDKLIELFNGNSGITGTRIIA
ncbi:acetylglutamate kinase [Gilliamella sp. B2776]|uniref:acetylglutamate kinase n=1 Tax=unclassified Gilliamella TaxID=2685620 RepID=UPI00226A2597|nr:MULTISPECIES: acetylglutamate kinase [unclassified Gilliamella]MCX8649616.1 acetylglutamate kinase [Gilliamella sp. B2779]MCX8654866.1 acetylglutamate kinase [Gilliamella sp. B2737]MCX8691394.1 acetylglutamate kinase [Gilliamella sp. B2776]MCX8702545.1 acetylglutamate kinase [Gilliamella sp. B2781]WDM18709.1 acetylglutamate kinase [Gilliamella sp. B3022]